MCHPRLQHSLSKTNTGTTQPGLLRSKSHQMTVDRLIEKSRMEFFGTKPLIGGIKRLHQTYITTSVAGVPGFSRPFFQCNRFRLPREMVPDLKSIRNPIGMQTAMQLSLRPSDRNSAPLVKSGQQQGTCHPGFKCHQSVLVIRSIVATVEDTATPRAIPDPGPDLIRAGLFVFGHDLSQPELPLIRGVATRVIRGRYHEPCTGRNTSARSPPVPGIS